MSNPGSEKLRLKTITDIKEAGLSVKKIIINSNLTESEAFAAEAALINAFNFVNDTGLTNIVSGHYSTEALQVEDFEKLHGAIELKEEDIKHNILVIKINKLYNRNMSSKELYDCVRGVWRASMTRVKTVDYVLGVYNSLIVAVYKPTQWFRCKDNMSQRPRQSEVLTTGMETRLYFVDENYEKGLESDANEKFYLGKSLAKMKMNNSAQNPITYLIPERRTRS